MKIEKTELEGVFVISNFVSEDERGLFVKTFNKNDFKNKNLNINIRESYYSVSQKDVLRGMHFQLPPHAHEKLVYVATGAILDVVLDLRKNSSTYLQHVAIELSSKNRKSIFIPKGIAHGFKSLENNTITVYNVATEYDKNSDCGIKFDSFGFDWKITEPILSIRDLHFTSLNNFISPF